MIKLSENGKLFARLIGQEFYYSPEHGEASGILTETSTHTISLLVTQMFRESGYGDVLCGIGEDGAEGWGQPRVLVSSGVATLRLDMNKRGEGANVSAGHLCDLRIVHKDGATRIAARDDDREWVEIYRSAA